MVQGAFPAPGSRVSVSTAAVQINGAMAEVQQDGPVLDCPPVDSRAFIDDRSSDIEDVESFEPETRFPMSFDLDDELKSDHHQHKHSDARERTVEAELPDMPEDATSKAQVQTSNSSAQDQPADTYHAPTGEVNPTEQSDTLTESLSEGVRLFDDHTEARHRTEREAVTDPLEDPLPAWDHSQNEWPVLVAADPQKSFRARRVALAALVLLTCAIGFYLLILQPVSREPRVSVPADSAEAERAPAAAEPGASAAKSADSSLQQGASPSSSERPASADSPPIQAPEAGNIHGKFSLQAAAFPTQAAADEFADKLKRAGLPSYVVGTDLGRRGRWFRVRVGRFNTADDVQRFAAEAQLRAKAAGMSLQLIACQYDQP